MGPIALFDKSFLQGLSVDESVWFDHFFLANVCPLFFVETLADLEKSVRPGRQPEDEVAIIADKFPEVGGAPCRFHGALCCGELMGQPVPMDGRIPRALGRVVRREEQVAVVYDHAPEALAFARWSAREFGAKDRVYAKTWRAAIAQGQSPEHRRRLGAIT